MLSSSLPKSIRLLLALALLGSAHPNSLRAEDLNRSALEKLASTLEQAVAKLPQTKPGRVEGLIPDSPGSMARLYLQQLRTGIAGNDPATIETALSALTRLVSSEPLRKQCEPIIAQLEQARLEQERKAAEEIQQLLESAGPTVRAAQKAADLDGLLSEIARLQVQGRNLSSASRLEGIQSFAKLWQNYLSCSAYGNGRGAKEALRELSNSNGNQPDLIPRSEILSRLNALANPIVVRTDEPDQGGDPAVSQVPEKKESLKREESADAKAERIPEPKVEKPFRLDPASHRIECEIDQLEELEKASESLNLLQSKPEFAAYRGSIDSLVESLEPVLSAFKRYQAGFPLNLESLVKDARDPNRNKGVLLKLRAQLITLALPAYLHLPAETKAKPEEGPMQFLERLGAEAAAKEDFSLVVRTRDALRLLRDGAKPNKEEADLANLFVQAKKNEEAGAFNLATVSYEKILASGLDLIAPSVIGKHLEAIRAAHPEDFQQGVMLYFFSPRIDGWPNGRPYPMGYPPGWPHPFPGMQGAPGPGY